MNSRYINKYSFLLLFFLLVSVCTIAQDEVNKDVKVVREYTPIISDAFKINELPSSDDDSSNEALSFDYDILTKAMSSGVDIEPISPAKLRPEHKTVLDKSYVKGALGNYGTVNGELYYNILRSKDYALGLNIAHTTSVGKVTLEDDTKSEAPFHDTYASLYFRRFYKKNTLSIDADFLHNIYRYYGYQTIDPEASYTYDSNTFNGSELMADERQRLSGFNTTIGFQNKEIESKNIPYGLKLNLGTFSNVTGVSETAFGLQGDVKFKIADNLSLNLDGGFDYFGASVPESTSLYNFTERNLTVINFSPNIQFDFQGGSVRVGFDMFTQMGIEEGDEFNMAPHIEGDLVIAEGIVTAFGGVKGDFFTNNYEKIQRENQFVAADQMVRNSFHGIHLFGGIKGNFSSTVSFVARVDHSVFTNEHFYVNRGYSTQVDETNVVHQSNLFDVVYDDGNLFSASGELKYEPNKKLNVLLFGKYNGWNLNDLDYAWHKPEVEVNLRANFSPMEDLWINVGLNTLGKRYAYDVTTDAAKELKPVYDFSVGGLYHISSKWNAFASINNMFASKYYQWNGYPMQRFNMRVGVGYSF